MKRNRPSLVSIIALTVCLSALIAVKAEEKQEIRYVAIGDSYTIGEGAKADEAWPSVLTKHLREQGINIELIANPSVTGWTTEMAIDRELPEFVKAKPNFATLLIGVNDWVRGVDEKTFRQRFVTLIDRMLELLPD